MASVLEALKPSATCGLQDLLMQRKEARDMRIYNSIQATSLLKAAKHSFGETGGTLGNFFLFGGFLPFAVRNPLLSSGRAETRKIFVP